MTHSLDVSITDFDEKVLAASRRVPVVVDFWAPWCQPCRILKPLLEKLAAEYGGKFILAKINSDENQEIAARYGVRGIPAVKAFIDGALVDEFTGALPENQIREFLDRLIPSPAEPLRQEALALAAAGDIGNAIEKMAAAIKLDPANDTVYLDFVELSLAAGSYQEAADVLDIVADRAHDRARIATLQAQLALVKNAPTTDIDTLRSRITVNGNDLEARLQLANALAVMQDYRGALEQFLDIVRQDRRWEDEAGRKGMLNLFTLLDNQPRHEALVREFRIALARTLN